MNKDRWRETLDALCEFELLLCFLDLAEIVIVTNDDDSLELYAIVFDVTAGIPAFYLILEKKSAICEAAIGLLFHFIW